MKKIFLLLSVLVLALSSSFLFAACSDNVDYAGSAWANGETFTYDIIENGEVIGELTVELTKLNAGEHYLKQVREEPFTITSSDTKGMRYKQTAKDNEGNVIMESESIMNGFSSAAGYKKINFRDKNFESKSYIDGKYYYYTLNGGEQERIATKTGFVDNELMYAWLRIYDIDSGYSAAIKVIDPLTGTREDFTATAYAENRKTFTVNYVTLDGEEKSESVSCITASFTKTSSPKGFGIEVLYTVDSFKLYGSSDSAGNLSYHIPVQIIENDLTYKLTKAEVR